MKATKSKKENIKEVSDFVEEPLSLETKALIEEIRSIQKDFDYKKLKNIGSNKFSTILVIIKHSKSCLETFITETCQ